MIVSLAEAQARLDELVSFVVTTQEDVTITRDGQPVAVLISADRWSALAGDFSS